MDTRYQRIARKLLGDIVTAGHTFSINDGGAWVVRRSVDVEAGIVAMFSSDEDIIHVRDREENYLGMFHLIHGNEPWEMIADYTDTPRMNAIIAGANLLGNHLEQASPLI